MHLTVGFEKGQGKKVSVFNGKELLESKNVREQSNTDSKNKSVKSAKTPLEGQIAGIGASIAQ